MRTFVLFLLLLPTSVFAHAWQVDMAKSSLTFSCSYQNGPFTGKFGKFSAAINYDANDLAHAKFDVSVAMVSVDTQSSERDQTLATGDFFDTAKFPQAHFVTSEFIRDSAGNVKAIGVLTVRDRFHPVALKVKFSVTDGATTLDVDTVLNRFDFGLGANSDWADIDKNVSVHGHLVLTPKP